ncbi:hypothetical protein ILYODFUR_019187 [Ilyodon furcidens]|uniref:Uncharacterized protein n=1 Tax=Ilyodon furcidens TaxID=33524 RepID=A0ABV0SP92_9TELE
MPADQLDFCASCGAIIPNVFKAIFHPCVLLLVVTCKQNKSSPLHWIIKPSTTGQNFVLYWTIHPFLCGLFSTHTPITEPSPFEMPDSAFSHNLAEVTHLCSG